MGLVKTLLALLVCSAATLTAKADTLHFTATVTSGSSGNTVPIGSTYTGYVHFAGTPDPNSIAFPPAIDAFSFTYPSAPTSVDALWHPAISHLHTGDPFYVLLSFLDPSTSEASFDITNHSFTIFDPFAIQPDSYNARIFALGSVTYTYEKDPVTLPPTSAVPEPSTLFLVGSGILGVFGAGRRRVARV